MKDWYICRLMLISLVVCLPLWAEEGTSKPSVRERAQQGEPFAQFVVGYLYYRGEPTAADLETAFGWWRKSAESGYADAQFIVGDCYRKGEGVEVDEAKAISWYRKSAQQKHAFAAFALADAYRRGFGGLRRDVLQQWRWTYLAWRRGYPYPPQRLRRFGRHVAFVLVMVAAVMIGHTLYGARQPVVKEYPMDQDI